MILTQQQIQQLLEIIERQQAIFIGKNIGADFLTPRDLELLSKAGIDITSFGKEGMIDDAFKWGMLSEALGDGRAKKMTYDEFKRFVSSGQFIPLNDREKFSLDILKRQFSSDVKNLSNKMQNDTNTALSASSRNASIDPKKFERILNKEAQQAIIDRKSVVQFASDLRVKSKDWNRDMQRVADYMSHTAFENGRAANMLRTDGEEAEVYKSVYPGACQHCIRLYLTGGIGSEPKVFLLKELIANGSNIGRKPVDWLPVIGATHPWCRCTSHKKEANSTFDSESGMFKLGDFQRKVERKSKIQITVGGRKTEI